MWRIDDLAREGGFLVECDLVFPGAYFEPQRGAPSVQRRLSALRPNRTHTRLAPRARMQLILPIPCSLFELSVRKDQPLLYPLARWEMFEANDGMDSTDAVALAVGGFVRSNINVVLEYWKEISVPTGDDKNDRLTLFFNIGI